MTDEPHDKAAHLFANYATWMFSVFFTVVPLLVFLFVLQVFTPEISLSDVPFEEELKTGAIASLSAAVSLLKYSIFIFVHMLICFAVGGYFLVRMLAYGYRWFTLLFCAILAVISLLAIIELCMADSAYRQFMILPIQEVLIGSVAFKTEFLWLNKPGFFTVALLVFPTIFGIIVVILASGGYHARILFSEMSDPESEDRKKETAELKSDLTVLSAVLVSSTLTARIYFHLGQNLFENESSQFLKVMSELAGTLSSGAGMLFSATLIATFTPGLIISAAKSGPLRGDEARLFQIGTNLATNLSKLVSKFRDIWKTVLALAAPAAAAPLMDMFASTLS